MDLFAARAVTPALRDCAQKQPHKACLDIELLATREEAEARVDHWHDLGLRHIWLHEVSQVMASDLRDGATLETALSPNSNGVIYVIVKLG